MKVLVTGGAGFIGGYVVKELLKRGYDPIVFDHYDRGGRGYPLFIGDVTDATAITEAMSHVGAWIHLAGVLGTQETIQNPRPAIEGNIIGGLNVLEAAAQHDVPGVCIGIGNHFMNNTYSITKATIERFVDMFNKHRGTRINVVRAMNAYGPGQKAFPPFGESRVRKITPSFVCRALAGMPLEIYGDGSQVSDMIYVGDVSKALVTALDKAIAGEVFPAVVEIGPAVHNTVKEFAELVIEMCGSDSKIVCLPMRPGEVPNSIVSANTDTMRMVDMKPVDLVTLRQGMAETIRYFTKKITGEE